MENVNKDSWAEFSENEGYKLPNQLEGRNVLSHQGQLEENFNLQLSPWSSIIVHNIYFFYLDLKPEIKDAIPTIGRASTLISLIDQIIAIDQ